MSPHRGVIATAVALTAASLVVTGCHNDPAGPAPATPTVSASAPAPTAAPGGGAQAPSSGAATTGTQPGIADGRWPAYVTAVGRGTLTMDLVEFLTGDRAAREWRKRHPGSPDRTPPNDYLIVNDNPRERTLPIAPHLSVKVVDGGPPASREVGVAGLRTRLRDTLFWLTVDHGTVVLVRQQFLP